MKLTLADDLYISLDEFGYNPFLMVMVLGERIGMYSVTGSMSKSWEETLNEFLDSKMREQ